MDSKIERRKAIRLALIGSSIIAIIIFLTGWFALFLIGLITPESTFEGRETNVNYQGESYPNVSGLQILIQEYEVSNPYNFSANVYALDPNSDPELSAEAVVFNTEVEQFIQRERDLFEDDLVFFLGSINQPDGTLKIEAVDIKKEGTSIVITYDITTRVSKDDGEAVVTKQQIISLL